MTDSELETLIKTAEAGDAEAQFAVGSHYMGLLDSALTLRFFRMAAAQGHQKARELLGWLCFSSQWLDKTEALAWLDQGIATGSVDGIFIKALLIRSEKPEEAAVLWAAAANAGQPEALYYLGDGHLCGKGVPRDIARAQAYITKAIEVGSKEALRHGYRAVTPALVEKVQAETRQAENGDSGVALTCAIVLWQMAQFNLALKWFQAAAGRKNPDALNRLSVLYRDGVGVAPDAAKADALMIEALEAENMEQPF